MGVNTIYTTWFCFYLFWWLPKQIAKIDSDFEFLHRAWNDRNRVDRDNHSRRSRHSRRFRSHRHIDNDSHRDEDISLNDIESGRNSGRGSGSASTSGSGLLVDHPNFVDENMPDHDEESPNRADGENNNLLHRDNSYGTAGDSEETKRFLAYRFLFRIFMVCFYFTVPFITRIIWTYLMSIKLTRHELDTSPTRMQT
ncbi:hypothetical protein Sste5346_010148 [Sporothrix stenoceras]|uniref:Uncharacterized protein n=1 Tax=Sporothrix stenoceras TaxID=5173 RepID=A0ABR3YGV4_9PEZI